jgi:hypothetical protein
MIKILLLNKPWTKRYVQKIGKKFEAFMQVMDKRYAQSIEKNWEAFMP